MRDRMRRSSCACCTTLALVLPLELPCLRIAFIAKRSPVSARVTLIKHALGLGLGLGLGGTRHLERALGLGLGLGLG